MLGLNPEELNFMLSVEGQAAIAAAKRDHETRERWKGPNATPWSEAHTAMAVRSGHLERERQRLTAAEFEAGRAHRTGEETALRAVRNAALARREEGRNNGAA